MSTEKRELITVEDYEQLISGLGYTQFTVKTHWGGRELRHPQIFVNGEPMRKILTKIREYLQLNNIKFHAGYLRDVLAVMAFRENGFYD